MCVLFKLALSVLALCLLFSNVTAHMDLSPGELVEYHQSLKRDGEALARCLQSPDMREHHARMLVHRDQTLRHVRQLRGINKRDAPAMTKWAALNHEQKLGHSRDPQDIFNFRWSDNPNDNASGCALTPTSIYGPYWREGQLERQDIRDGQDGIYLRLAMQVIDTGTCKPLHGAQVDVWEANAVGAYSGVKTGYLRGWQPTSPHGTVDFDSIFPGHYLGRASHIHVAVRAVKEKRVAHIGQIYFDQWLRNAIEASSYKNNSYELVDNHKDAFIPYDASDMHDPFVRWSKVSNNPHDGVLAWITLGVNTTNYGVEQPPNMKRSLVDWHLG
ncbi:Intradiol ring-cleavage dioxygenase [Pyrenochaeta sp. MPI-SDFR-AT-0127]|nr:Intradiol ring-cleavage dioxygenase [Pyrenochaeta sp. MPI-SDFR-AT-0127]